MNADAILSIEIVPGDRTAISLAGELDLSNAAALRKALDAVPACAETVFDLTALSFIDSSGLTVLANYTRRVLPAGRVTVVAPNASMRRLFATTALDTVLNVVDRQPD